MTRRQIPSYILQSQCIFIVSRKNSIDYDLSTKAGRVLAERHVAALRKAADEIMVVLEACGGDYEKSDEDVEIKEEISTEEKSDETDSVETKDSSSSMVIEDEVAEDAEETEVIGEEVETTEKAEVTDEVVSDDSDSTEVVEEVDEKSDDSDLEIKESDELADEKSEEINDADFMRSLAEFEEFLSDEND